MTRMKATRRLLTDIRVQGARRSRWGMGEGEGGDRSGSGSGSRDSDGQGGKQGAGGSQSVFAQTCVRADASPFIRVCPDFASFQRRIACLIFIFLALPPSNPPPLPASPRPPEGEAEPRPTATEGQRSACMRVSTSELPSRYYGMGWGNRAGRGWAGDSERGRIEGLARVGWPTMGVGGGVCNAGRK